MQYKWNRLLIHRRLISLVQLVISNSFVVTTYVQKVFTVLRGQGSHTRISSAVCVCVCVVGVYQDTTTLLFIIF